MPDSVASPEPDFTKRQQFWLATNGHLVISHLLREQGQSYVAAFSEAFAEARHKRDNAPTETALHEDIERDNRQLLLKAFFDKTYPVDKPYQRQVPVMAWIAERYLNDTHNGKQILAEDLYKIGQDVRYLQALKDGGHIAPDVTIESHASLKDLSATLAPFARAREAKRAEHLERHMDPALKKDIINGTTMFYDGPAGKIVLCHTIEASRYWGNGTKWCISAREDQGLVDFNRYSTSSPIIMFLPKDARKMALVEGRFWNDEDIAANDPGEDVERLLIEASSSLAPSVLKFLETHWPMPADPICATEMADESLEHLSQKEHEMIALYRSPDSDDVVGYWVDPKFRDNKHVMLAAVQRNGLLLKHGSSRIKEDYDVVLAAVTERGTALKEAGPNARQNRTIALQAIKEDEEAIRAVDYSLHRPDFFIAALQANPLVLDELEDWPRQEKNVWLKAAPTAALRLRACSYSGINEDQEILKYQMRALRTLISQGDIAEAQAGLRFIKPLWGQPERITGDPAVQLTWLQSRYGPRPSAAPQLRAA